MAEMGSILGIVGGSAALAWTFIQLGDRLWREKQKQRFDLSTIQLPDCSLDKGMGRELLQGNAMLTQLMARLANSHEGLLNSTRELVTNTLVQGRLNDERHAELMRRLENYERRSEELATELQALINPLKR